VLAHSRSKNFAFRQAPILVCVVVPLVVGLVVLAFDFAVGRI